MGDVLVLVALVVLAGVGAFAVAAAVFGRSDVTAPQRHPAQPELPDRELRAADLDGLEFSVALRGYRMTDVDSVLLRLREELAARERADEPADGPARERLDGPTSTQ